VDHAGAPEVTEPMAQRVIAYWASVDADLGARVAAGLSGDGNGSGGSNGPSAEASELLAARANRA